ncbi:CchlQ [Streptomyces gilvosporeus]|uniref:CchlQ n=1 Tax=Streptomyces gilvosporeus TaxID=553510 RepID=A0A1V0U227_9ACTN|nr:CchlQ [Streptomyces gilvosporeus]ARF59078.1 CchlQ [Streptomyces gilvosporeus]
MDWATLVATVSGGLVAISGTVLADHLRHRHDSDRSVETRRRAVYIEFITAAGVCHTRLRRIAQAPQAETDLDAATRAALNDAELYEVRERLFIDATTAVAGAGQAMFERLGALRRAVAAGAAQHSRAFHDAYHPYLAAVWAYRVAVRKELEGLPLSPGDFGWEEWDSRDRCALCAEADAGEGAGAGAGD